MYPIATSIQKGLLIICFFMYYPFRNEQNLKADIIGMYTEQLNEAGILDIINAKKQVFEPFGDFVDSDLLHMPTNIAHNDAFSGQENDQVQQDTVSDFEDPADDAVVIDNNYAISNNYNSIIHDDELNEKIASLNIQRQICDIIHDWPKEYVKNLQAHMFLL